MHSFTKDVVSFGDTNSFDRLILDYLNNDPFLRKFYAFENSIDGILQRIKSYENSRLDRNLLKSVIYDQYTSSAIKISEKVSKNIKSLTEATTFTVTTGHQLNVVGGPLYVIYKLVSTICLAENLKKLLPEYNFVPVYWMATEDHDISEITNINLYGRGFNWNSSWKGASGKMPLNGLEEFLNELKNVFGNSIYAEELLSKINSAYLESANLAEATRKWIDSLLGKYGLLILDGNDRSFKKNFSDVIKDEVLKQSSSTIINETTAELGQKYHPQVNPREINLFYLGENFRERITRDEQEYQIINTDLRFTNDEIINKIEEAPENFSPNVVLRPLFQESILPDIAFVGGPAEISYWLELKNLFDYHKIPMPVLIHRCSVLLIEKNIAGKLKKLSIKNPDVFLPVDVLIKNYLHRTDHEQPEFENVTATITGEFKKLKNAVSLVDVTLKAAVEAESIKVTSSLQTLEEKIIRSLKKKNETEVNQIRNIKEKLFPGNKLQERQNSILQYYLQWGDQFIETLMKNFNPLEKQFIILEEKE
jgi:bacillithiol biosynthesis cysteine-adding enzyme BshC